MNTENIGYSEVRSEETFTNATLTDKVRLEGVLCPKRDKFWEKSKFWKKDGFCTTLESF